MNKLDQLAHKLARTEDRLERATEALERAALSYAKAHRLYEVVLMDWNKEKFAR